MSRPTAFHTLTTLLSVTILIAVFAGGWLLSSPAGADPQSPETEQVVRDFYTAVNLAIRTGNTAALDDIVSPDVVVHGELASLAAGRASLDHYLFGLRDTTSQPELTVTNVTVAGDQAVATIAHEREDDPAFLGNMLNGAKVWGEVDAFRVRNNQIVEFWSGTTEPVLLESIAQTPFAVVSPPERAMTLDRLTIPVGGSYGSDGFDERRWLLVERGVVTASSLWRERPRSIELALATAGNPEALDFGPFENRNPAPLEPGDLVPLPQMSRTDIHNVGSEPASLLVLAAGSPGSISGLGMDPGGHGSQTTTDAVKGWPGWWNGASRVSESGAMLASLTGVAQTTLPGKRTAISVGLMTLGPGATLTTHVAGPELLVVDAGVLDLVSEGAPAWIYNDRGIDLHVGALTPGAGALLHAGSVVHLRNSGDETAVVTVISIVPDEAFIGGAV